MTKKTEVLTLEQTFEVLIDPRLEIEGITMQMITDQLNFQNKVTDLLSEARKLQSDLENKLEKTKNKEEKKKLEMLLKELKNEEGAYPQEMLVDQISYLSYITSDADKEIGNDAKERYTELVSQLHKLKSKVTLN